MQQLLVSGWQPLMPIVSNRPSLLIVNAGYSSLLGAVDSG
ncbi:hypothetical protein Maes01_02724 [Microbulbifer aestuariivivens]|uniref:Uncharacterized protein n=1 Tax=Microbulbifer aestuariivivens TaxID=1908308 RepID=A0ABP9WSF4_9GAMM